MSRRLDPPMQAEGRNFRPNALRWYDLVTALGLGVLVIVLVMSTTRGIGFTRDETFYFHFAKVYTNWFVALERADSPEERARVLGREEVDSTWNQNFEHPPLMKTLFGLSWRFLGQKSRDIRITGPRTVRITGLGRAHGFEEGEQVLLLAPRKIGEESQVEDRSLGFLTITRRTDSSADATLLGALPGGVENIKDICTPGGGKDDLPEVYGGCKARSQGGLKIFSESDSFRFPGAVSAGLLVLLLFLMALELFGRPVAFLATAFLVFIPRVFFHMHLTCFDIPMTAIGFAVIYAFWKSERSFWWGPIAGVLWGLALLTKLNAFFIPVTLGLYWLATLTSRMRSYRFVKLRLPSIPPAFFWMIGIGPVMLFLLWPALWYDPIESFGRYLAFHLKHEHYLQYYFGDVLQTPPFPILFPFAMTFFTVPVLTLAMFFLGFARTFFGPGGILRQLGSRIWRLVTRTSQSRATQDRPWAGVQWFLLINLLFPIILIAMPNTPIFGGVKHWFLSMPFLAMLAGSAAWSIFASLKQMLTGVGGDTRLVRMAGTALGALVLTLILMPGVRDTLKYCNYGTGYFNELMGGPRGGADARMQRQFWSYATLGALDYLNHHAPRGSVVDFQDATQGACSMYKLEEMLRDDIRCVVRKGNPDYLLFDVEERFSEEEMRYLSRMKTAGPLHEAAVDGVPMVRLYGKKKGFQEVNSEADR